MALEKSVLTLKEIEKVLRDKYGIDNIQDIIHIDNSSANCYHIICTDKQYFLKEIQSNYSYEKVQEEYKINKFLKKRDIPTSEFYKTFNGKYIWEYKNHIFHLQSFIEGTTYKMNTAPKWLIKDSAIYLGKIHNELKGYPNVKDRFGERLFLESNIQRAKEIYEDLIEKSRNVKDESIRLKIVEDLKFRLSILPKITKFQFDYDKFTVSNSQGDYSLLQIICGENKINAIIDFTDSCSLPICWEIIRSYTYADPKCKEGLQIDIDNFKEYIKLYLEHNLISPYDVKMMPYLYYFHLARSSFGYKQYILSPEKYNEELLQFGFWRTNMCRWLDKNVELLSKELEDEFCNT
ncbi:aminoglycoside phosphotransferase [Oceanirhabdus sp. W0125-5]|uniref:aminoglycoside phosphotransferase n=1 Tax=Oceanirhabdus sp. W0125-5 TaxID=2999116 RepID=UPI0022F2B989|nr:aminoglycoside phosphotransferase [Oceanirhabdus sp. W0125-5]WBW96506.1 aminoglycoside phosphotransferase [Oceanirhabdus sp. W0125-5]